MQTDRIGADSKANGEQDGSILVKRPYQTPSLVCFGSVQDLTQGTSIKSGDAGTNTMV